jgi:hypothetical protein
MAIGVLTPNYAMVRAIHVRDGMAVKAGDVLIELDTTMNLAERDHIRSDLIAAQLDIARLRAALSDAEDPVVNFQPPEGASPGRTLSRSLLRLLPAWPATHASVQFRPIVRRGRSAR